MLLSISTESKNSPLTFPRLSQSGHPLQWRKLHWENPNSGVGVLSLSCFQTERCQVASASSLHDFGKGCQGCLVWALYSCIFESLDPQVSLFLPFCHMQSFPWLLPHLALWYLSQVGKLVRTVFRNRCPQTPYAEGRAFHSRLFGDCLFRHRFLVLGLIFWCDWQ